MRARRPREGQGRGDPVGQGPGPGAGRAVGTSSGSPRGPSGPTQAAVLVFAAVAGFIRLRSLTGVEFM